MRRGDVPLGIKIISIIYYIGAGIFALTALGFIVIGIVSMLNTELITSTGGFPDFIKNSPNIGLAILITGFLIALLAILCFFVAIGVNRGRRWARILIIIFVAIGILSGFVALFSGEAKGILNLIFSGIVGGYLLFNKEAKEFFS